MRGKKTSQAIIEEIKALAPFNDSITELAKKLGLPEQTARDVIRRDDKFVEVRAKQKKRLILQATKKAEEFLETLNPENAKSEAEKSVVFGTLVDKTMVLAGEDKRWSAQTFNVGDNRQFVIQVSKEAESLLHRGK